MNFVIEYEKGQRGENFGLSTGINSLDIAMNGVQRKAIYSIGAPPKAGKTTFLDFAFVLSPYLLSPDEEIHWIYYSFEIDRVRKEFKYACYFLYHDYGVNLIQLPEGSTHKGSNSIAISPDYLMGKVRDDNGNLIPVQKEIESVLMEVYKNRIVPLFGDYDDKGNKITDGVIDFVEERDNPTGLRNYVLDYANENGEFIFQPYTTTEKGQKVEKQRIVGWKPDNPKKYVIIITDHVRKPRRERGYTEKENIDKWIEYQVELRNWCGFTFVNIIHTNRNLSSVERMKYNSEFLYPTGDDLKGTGNLSEESDFVITMFNPNDERYSIKTHFGLQLRDIDGGELHPHYRSIHLVDSRDTECPQHLQVNMYGNINSFDKILN